MDLPVPPSQARNALFNREDWAGFVDENVLIWKRRLTDLGPDELRKGRDDLQARIERCEEGAEEVLRMSEDLAREIASYADLDEETAVEQARRILQIPREVPLTLNGEPTDLWEERKVFSEAAPGDRKAFMRLARRYNRLRRKIQREKFSLRIVEHVHGQYLRGSLEVEDGSEDREEEHGTNLHPSTEEYLRTAKEWIDAGNRPSGDKPTELWTHLHEQTGASRGTIRKTFKNHEWYDPTVGSAPEANETPTEHTIQSVRDAFQEHLG
jgi:hypothetical protein